MGCVYPVRYYLVGIKVSKNAIDQITTNDDGSMVDSRFGERPAWESAFRDMITSISGIAGRAGCRCPLSVYFRLLCCLARSLPQNKRPTTPQKPPDAYSPVGGPLPAPLSPANGDQPFGGQEKVSSDSLIFFVRARTFLRRSFFLSCPLPIPLNILRLGPYFYQIFVSLVFLLLTLDSDPQKYDPH